MRSLNGKDSNIPLSKLQLYVHVRVASGGIPMEAPVLSVRWDPNESLEASARLRSNTGLHTKRAWKGAPALSCSAVRTFQQRVRQSEARG